MITINGYPIDCAKVIEHSLEAEVTSEPVESGAEINDHVQRMPPRVTIEGWVSDTPIGELAILRAADGLLNPFASHSDTAYATLKEISEAGEPVVVETDLRRYDDMILKSLSVPQDAGTGDALMFRADFVQVNIVETEQTLLRVSVPRAAGKKNLGHKPSPTVGPGTPPPDYLLADSSTDPRFVGANSGGRKLVGFGGGEGASSRVPIASGGSGL